MLIAAVLAGLLPALFPLLVSADSRNLKFSIIGKDDSLIISGPWYYKWGDSPVAEDGRPLWATQKVAEPDGQPVRGWSVTSKPYLPPGRNGNKLVWFRTILPYFGGRAPSLFIHSVDLTFEMYLDGKLIYKFGCLDQNGHGKFSGWPWHLIRLPADFGGKSVAFRVWSDSDDMGLVGKIILGNETRILKKIVFADLDQLILVLLFFFSGGLFLLLSLGNKERLASLSISLFSIIMGIYTLTQTNSRQLLVDYPMFWIYVNLGSLYIVPVPLSLFISRTYGSRYKRIMQILAISFLTYAAASVSMSALGIVSFPDTIRPFNIMELLGLAVMLIISITSLSKGNPDAKIFTLGLVGIGVFAIRDIILSWNSVSFHPLSHWGIFIFLLSMGLILRRRIMGLHEQSIVDGLTGVFNRRYFDSLLQEEWRRALRVGHELGLIMVDIDFFKRYNDEFGHPKGDECLKLVATTLKLVARRGGEAVARYGGEEFVVILPSSGLEEALNMAEKMRSAVRALDLKHPLSSVDDFVTISAGTASLKPDASLSPMDLVKRADEALYKAKQRGRNQVYPTIRSLTGKAPGR
ncbi:MAG: diguanylate cyclase [Deltaproteobacteria bacterium]|nr:diguanylate cyclase [Deltaproteobacteria bacterium]